jgi:hypothetical protein
VTFGRKNGCIPFLKPNPVNETRYGMGGSMRLYVQISLWGMLGLLGPDGDDMYMLRADEIAQNNFSQLTCTHKDKMMLCQEESATMSAKFFQLHKTTKNLVLCSL